MFMATQVSAQSNPLQTCSAAQVTATQRWWYFGSGGILDFGVNGNNPVVLPSSGINTAEGSIVVSDSGGNLLFWVGGRTGGSIHIYHKNGVIMDNGGGITANVSASQTLASFGAIGIPGKYFVISTTGDATVPAAGSLYYSVVDMRANGGLGRVASKNVLLIADAASEAVAAIPNATGTGFWVLTFNKTNANVTAIPFADIGPGPAVTTTLTTQNGESDGAIAVSPDLSRIAMVSGNTPQNLARLLEFNAPTGVFTEKAQWTTGATGGVYTNRGTAYGADFSPDGQYLYVTHAYTNPQGGGLWRYNLGTETSSAIQGSEEYIRTLGTTLNSSGAIRRGPDGRMYIASDPATSAISVIAMPNASNVANINSTLDSLLLGSGTASAWGLPQMVAGCPVIQAAPMNVQQVPVGNIWTYISLGGVMTLVATLGLRTHRTSNIRLPFP